MDDDLIGLHEAASLLGDLVTEGHVRARLRRGSLEGRRGEDGTWRVYRDSIMRALADAPACDGCGRSVTEYVIIKYPHHDRVEFELCAEHAAKTALAYQRRGSVWEVVTFPFQSEGWMKPRPRSDGDGLDR